jgi:catechol 2,3-dioxygenase-like lactoylglutathione lyase family enzyme
LTDAPAPARAAHLILFVRDQERSRAFYEAALGVPPRLHAPGMTEFALREGVVLGLMPESGIHGLLPALPDPAPAGSGTRAELYLVVAAPDERLEWALSAGATELSPVQPRDWGDDVGYCLDPDGHVLAFAAPTRAAGTGAVPRMPAAAACELLDLLEARGIPAWVDGGWAVDAVLGEQTREHGDLDVALEERFAPVVRALLAARGFRELPRADTSPWNFVLGDAGGLELDVHAVTFDERGDGVLGPPERGEAYPADALTGEGVIAGRRVRCVSPVWLVRFRAGFEPRDVDRLDVAALCARFGLEPPAAYRGGGEAEDG